MPIDNFSYNSRLDLDSLRCDMIQLTKMIKLSQ